MKAYSIGREPDCEIIINDLSNVVSRRHATLYVSPLGKMTIVDVSQNGTYVNGLRISQNVPFPVTRKDTVSFAHTAKLDWDVIPNPLWWVKYLIGIGVMIILIICGLLAFCSHSETPKTPSGIDSVSLKAHELEKQEKAKQDSIKKAEKEAEQIRLIERGAKKPKHVKRKETPKPVNTEKKPDPKPESQARHL